MVLITSDHGGFELKNEIINLFEQTGLEYQDMGPTQFVKDDDYPDYVIPTMKRFQTLLNENKNPKAIVICKNGVGVSMLANKFAGIRCGLSWDEKHVESAVIDDNINVLALPANYIDTDKTLKIITTWLDTEFSKEPRHIRRLQKVQNFQEPTQNLK